MTLSSKLIKLVFGLSFHGCWGPLERPLAILGRSWRPKDGLSEGPLPSWILGRSLGLSWTQSGTQNCPFWVPILGLKLKKKTWEMTIDDI